jgi:hypothetical protein
VAGLERLEQFRDVNFEHRSLPRLPWQTVQYQQDTIPQAMAQVEFKTPYVWFTNQNSVYDTDAWLWRESPVVSETQGNGSSLVPRSAHAMINTQVYDYPWLEHVPGGSLTNPLDIVFISNGERGAWGNLLHLEWAVQRCDGNRIHHVEGVQGRVAAYQAAARASQTDWFFAVFAKLEVSSNFDWSWQPDRWQQPKHYIFHAANPINGLIYGHQAMIAYNKNLVLSNPGVGLDFTLDQPHEVVPIISGTAMYFDTPWMAWRTAFREAIKLRHSLPNVENQYRLSQWLRESNALKNAEWSHMGAQDAMEYYDSVSGDFDQLRKSYEWSWLASYALLRRNLVADL